MVFLEFNGGSAKAVTTALVGQLACFVRFALFLSFSPYFPSPPAFCRYLAPRLRVVSSLQQLPVSLQHVCCSCSLSDLLVSHSSEFLPAIVFCRSYTGISSLVFVLFRPCSGYLFLFSTYVVILAAFLIFLQPSWSSCITFFRTPVGFFCSFSYFLSYFSGLACLLCSRTRYASISPALPRLITVALVLVCLSLWPHN